MNKARRIKVQGVEYKYYLDTGALDDDHTPYSKVILYKDGKKFGWWNGHMKTVTNPEVKETLLKGKFYNYQGIIRI